MTLLQVVRHGVKPSLITRAFHRFQERVRNPQMRRHLATAVTLLRRNRLRLGESGATCELMRDGCAMFPAFLSRNQATEIREALEKMDCFDPWCADAGRFSCQQIPPGTHVAQIADAPRLEILYRLAMDPRLIELATDYFGCPPYLDSIQAWWSVSGNDQPQEAENFHRDNDSICFLKFFIYLTDVGKENGPHVYAFGSHASPKLTVRRRLTDDEVVDAFGRSQVREITGAAGDAFMEDTFGIHKGQLPAAGIRLLVQFRYSVTETIFRSPLIVSRSANFDAIKATSLIHE